MMSPGNYKFASYYKLRIIITFTIVTAALVLVLSRAGYIFIKDIYLSQLTEQVNTVTKLLSGHIDKMYLNLLDLGSPTGMTESYFINLFKSNVDNELHSEIFIFDDKLEVVIHSDYSYIKGTLEPRLLLNKKEISGLKLNSGVASMPFKGNDGKWYLWGFYRLNENSWLALKAHAVRFQKLDELSEIFWLIGLAGVFITIITGWFVAKSITKPLNELIKFSTEIGRRNFNISFPPNMKGEIKKLADAMNKMKDDLAENQNEREKILAQIAHEIRNPLGGIELLANLSKENETDKEKRTEYLDRILNEVNGLKLLITSYLNYSKPSPASPSWVNLNKLIYDTESIFDTSIIKKNIILVNDISLEKIYYDERHLKQIIMNLLDNSIDLIEPPGEITVSARESSGKWEIAVSDNGPGIVETEIKKIFDPFFTTKKNGTGLGLAISKRLSLENHSELQVKNNPVKGATFSLIKDALNEV